MCFPRRIGVNFFKHVFQMLILAIPTLILYVLTPWLADLKPFPIGLL